MYIYTILIHAVFAKTRVHESETRRLHTCWRKRLLDSPKRRGEEDAATGQEFDTSKVQNCSWEIDLLRGPRGSKFGGCKRQDSLS